MRHYLWSRQLGTIERFGKAKEQWFTEQLNLEHGIPSYNTLGDFFAIDGKFLRRSNDKASNKAAIYMPSAHIALNLIKIEKIGYNNQLIEPFCCVPMAQYFQIHPENPQKRLIHQAVDIIQKGGVIALPTDSSYALACHIGDKRALDKIRQIRQLSEKHNFTLLSNDLTQVSHFTKIDNDAYRLIKSLTPGAFTFILDATKEVPRRLQHPKKKTIGIRITGNIVARQIIEELGEPLCSSTLILPNKTDAETDPYDIRERLENELDLIIDFGIIEPQETTVISCVNSEIEIIRQGMGIAPMLDN